MDHFVKAQKLRGVDDEMGVIRCIAAEEELVVAIFEWLKLNSDRLPSHGDFIGKYKNHRVKLAFYSVLSQFRFVLGDMIAHGITFPGFEQVLLMKIEPSIVEGRLVLRLGREEPGEPNASIPLNPLNVSVSRKDLDHGEIVEEFYRDFEEEVREHNGMTVREFVTARAEFRNQQRTRDAAAAVEMAVEAAPANRHHGNLARRVADETRRRALQGTGRMASGRCRDRQGAPELHLRAQSQETANGQASRRPLSIAHQSHRE
jgi:hypothetical protein